MAERDNQALLEYIQELTSDGATSSSKRLAATAESEAQELKVGDFLVMLASSSEGPNLKLFRPRCRR